MRKVLYSIVFLIIFIWIWIWIFLYKQTLNEGIKKSNLLKTQLYNINNILLWTNPKPLPWWKIIYYTNNWKVVTWANYDIISWWLCWKEFTSLNIDIKDPFSWKCLKYTTNKERNQYEIWAIIKNQNWFETYLTWNTNNIITKNYLYDGIINDLNKDFPYNPNTKFVTAQIMNLQLWEQWKLIILDHNWKKHDITKNYTWFILNAYDTILLKGKNSIAYIKFENQDILKIEWWTIIKIKETEIDNENPQPNVFWLVWKIVYSIYDQKQISQISTPWETITIRWNILEWISFVDNKNYKIVIKHLTWENKTEIKEQKIYNVIKYINTDNIIDNDNLWADILWYKLNIEDLIKVDN